MTEKSTKRKYTIDEVKKFCTERGIILVDAQDYGKAIPVLLTRRQVSWGYVENHMERLSE